MRIAHRLLLFGLLAALLPVAGCAGRRDRVNETDRVAVTRADPSRNIWRGRELMSLAVRNLDGAPLGTVVDVVLSPDHAQIDYAAVRYQGKHYAVPWTALEMGRTPDGRAALIFDVDPKTLRTAAGFATRDWPETGNPLWLNEVLAARQRREPSDIATARTDDRFFDYPGVYGYVGEPVYPPEDDDTVDYPESVLVPRAEAPFRFDSGSIEPGRFGYMPDWYVYEEYLDRNRRDLDTGYVRATRGQLWDRRLSRLMELPIRDAADQEIGRIQDVVVDGTTGRVLHALVSLRHATIPGGEGVAPMPWTRLMLGRSGDAAMANIDPETLRRAAFARDAVPEVTSPEFARQVTNVYGPDPYWDVYGFVGE